MDEGDYQSLSLLRLNLGSLNEALDLHDRPVWIFWEEDLFPSSAIAVSIDGDLKMISKISADPDGLGRVFVDPSISRDSTELSDGRIVLKEKSIAHPDPMLNGNRGDFWDLLRDQLMKRRDREVRSAPSSEVRGGGG